MREQGKEKKIHRPNGPFGPSNDFYIGFKKKLLLDFEREREKHQLVVNTYLCIHWLILACALTRVQTRSLSTSGRCSNQLSYLARVYTGSLIALMMWRGFRFFLVV